MIRYLVAAAVVTGAVAWAAEQTPAPDDRTKALIEGQLPDDPAKPLVQSKCLLCHTGEYVTLQRLTEGQWQKTVEKMRKFGAPATDEEVKAMVAYLARNWTPDLPPPRPVLAPLPKGSVPGK